MLLDRLAEFFFSRPKRLAAVGKALCSVASTLVMLGACANVYTGAADAINSLGHQIRSQSTLADLLPGLPTWWIPETLIGFVFVIVIAIAGAIIAHWSRNLDRFLTS